MEYSLIGFACLLVLIFLRIPLALAMGVTGVVGFAMVQINVYGNPAGWELALSQVPQMALKTGMIEGLSVVPLFILMSRFMTETGISSRLYRASNAFLGHLRGGLAMATVLACGLFSAVCGSSMATSATMSKVAMPSMRRYHYADSLATGSIAAGGTLGILIPPSMILVIYGLMTGTDIGKLFMAGILPGVLGVLLYMAAVWVIVRLNPDSGPAAGRCSWFERLQALRGVWGVVLLFTLVMGGIYTGLFTPTGAAGMGACGALLIAVLLGKLSWHSLYRILVSTAETTAMLFFLLIGALLFSRFINLAGLPDGLGEWVLALDISPMTVLLLVIGIYLFLGMILESLPMVLLTVPVFYPVMQALGFDLIWFGILVVIVTEISLITPPVGLNVFVLKAAVSDVTLETLFRGVTPFWVADLVRLTLIATLPGISLLLPGLAG
ncbi:MAG TPA: TRAP transporter large permease [Thiolinea sp.]|nr:TRAP transporter large permease [Thiolinea sp.]